VRSARFPGIVFVTGPNGRRRARLIGGPDVWEVVLVARSYDWDAGPTATHLQVAPESVRLSLAYNRAYPDEIEAILQRLDAMDADPGQSYPTIAVIEMAPEPDAAAA